MASIAESSVNTAQYDKLAQFRDGFLEQPDAPNDTRESGAGDLDDTSKAATILESANAYNTPHSPPKGPPRLSASRSAPAAEMEALIQQASPSQGAFREFTKASSFHGYAGGDTQPMESQVYRDFTESMANPAATTPKKMLLRPQISPDGKTVYEMDTVDEEPNTVIEGMPGYVDLAKGWVEASPGAQSDSSHASELLRSPETQLQVGELALQTTLPETPSIAGSKRERGDDVPTSLVTTNKKTPGLTQLFGGGEKNGVMTGTQLFNQTQAPSSPIPDGPRSDPVMTRPSPSLPNQFSISSPSVLASSPVMIRNGRVSYMPGDPRDNYTSVKESQEARAANLRREWGVSDRFNEYGTQDYSQDDDQDPERRRFERQRLHRVVSENAMSEWQKVRAPSRPGSRSTSSPQKKVTTIDLVTPAAIKRAGQVDYEVSDDVDLEDRGYAGQDEAIVDIETENEAEDADEYDELGQTVLRSQGPAEESEVEQEGDENDDEAESTHSSDAGDDQSSPHQNIEHTAHQHRPTLLQAESSALQHTDRQVATQTSAIADSQPQQQQRPSSSPKRQVKEGLSLSSFVPGSQYTGRTSVDQALIPNKLQPSQEQDKIPSSPPLSLPREELGDDRTTVTSHDKAHGAHRLRKQASSVAELEVPESDLAMPDASQSAPSRGGRRHGESASIQLFSTARSHVSASGPLVTGNASTQSPFRASASQPTKSISQTPRTAAGVRHFADIANAASTPNGSGETEIDIDAIMSDVVTAEDQQVWDVMESPSSERASKRRKTIQSKSDTTESPVTRASSRVKQRARFEVTAQHPSLLPTTENEQESSPAVLQDAPSKANERRPVTPPTDEVPEGTPDSVKQREHAGAKVASQLLSRRSSRAPKPSALRTYKKAKTAPAKTTKEDKADSVPDLVEEPALIEETVLEAEDEHEAHPGTEQTEEQPQTASVPLSHASSRILALFKGSYNNFYPASWLNTTPDGRKYRVQFEDGNVTMLDTKHVRKFELRTGDVIKVDLPEMRGKTWVIDRMGRVAQTEQDAAYGTDCNGHITVHVQAKGSRVSGNGKSVGGDDETPSIEVSTSSIYLTQWAHFSDRQFTPPNHAGTDKGRLATPSTGTRTPDTGTPSSRSRRIVVPTAKAQAGRPSTLREESVVSSSPSDGQGLFANMAFAISYGSNEVERAEVSRLIVRNGGMILEHGFDELFEPPKLDEQIPTSPSKRTELSPLEENHVTGLVLKPQYERLGFVALIADKHSRRAKYVQALALGLPTLSGRWVADSLNSSKNKPITTSEAAPLSWSRYLLPAGESAYLGNAVRSRTLPVYPAAEAKLPDNISNRAILLNGDGVLIVASKKSKAVWERRKAYAFLTLALGAGGVKRVSDLEEAKTFTSAEGSKWKWVYVDGSVAEASKVMFAEPKDAGKKRKRDTGLPTPASTLFSTPAAKVDAKAMSASDGNVTLVNDEFVVQSLILGALVN